MKHDYHFTQDWFSGSVPIWHALIDKFKPSKILEIGSFEGCSACYLVEYASQHNPLELYCVDTWQGSAEHEGIDFSEVEERFNRNIGLAVTDVAHPVKVYKTKGKSSRVMATYLLSDVGEFDMIYIDGSHEAADVFLDAALAFQLLKVGGLMVFDDYQVGEAPKTVYDHPKIAIDAFMSVYGNKMGRITFEHDNKRLEETYQYYAQKVSP